MAFTTDTSGERPPEQGGWSFGEAHPDRPFDTEDNCPYIWFVRFEWDPAKAQANELAHGVRFTEAVTVLDDDFALTREDPDSTGEQRFVTLGMSASGFLLVVVYAYRKPDIVRIISAWKANKRQGAQYEKGRR